MKHDNLLGSQAMFPYFLRQLVEIIVETPVSAPTYSLLTGRLLTNKLTQRPPESTRLLIILLSSPLFCPPGKPAHQVGE